jgi:hypothetical protein
MTIELGKSLRLGCLAVAVGVIAASSSVAQAPATPGQQQFRDPKTGQIWTPQNVGGVSGPDTPADRAFNPRGQTAAVPGVIVQTPSVTLVGTVPIAAGPTVPIATLDDSSLSAIPGQRWQVVLYLNNNSAGTINPIINCRFTNAGNVVEQTQAVLPPVAGGQRVGLVINGPATTLFVDRADCALGAPT